MARMLPLFVITALLLAGCGEENKEKVEDAGRTIGEKAGQAWNKVKTFTAEQKDEAVKYWDENKGPLQDRYEKVKEKGGETLAARKKDFEAALAKAKEVGKEGWDSARNGVTAAYEAFQKELAKHE